MLSPWLYVAAAGAVVLGVQEIRVAHYKGEVGELTLNAERARNEALQEKADVEARWKRNLDDSNKQWSDQLDTLRADRDRAVESGRVWQSTLDNYTSEVRKALARPRVQGQSIGDPIGVLSNVLSRVDQAAEVYARTADERLAGWLKCERDFEGSR